MYPSIAAIIVGSVGAVFPETLIDWTSRLLLGPSFENAADLRPRGWYVNVVRIQSVLVALVGIAWVAVERRESEPEVPTSADLTPSEE